MAGTHATRRIGSARVPARAAARPNLAEQPHERAERGESMAGCLGRNSQLAADGRLKVNERPTDRAAVICRPSVAKRLSEVCIQVSDSRSGRSSEFRIPVGPPERIKQTSKSWRSPPFHHRVGGPPPAAPAQDLVGPLRRGSHGDRESAVRSALSSRSLRPHAMRCGVSEVFLIRGRHRVVRHHAVRPLGRRQ